MGKKGNGLAVFALIFGLIGAGTGGFLFVTNYLLVEEPEEIILPKARLYYDDSYLWVSHNTGKVIEFTDTSYDTHNAYNFTSNLYVIPESGFYQINAQYSVDCEAGDNYVIYIMVNNAFHSYLRTTSSLTLSNFGIGVNDIVNATVGDEIKIRAFFSDSTSEIRYFSGGEYFTFFTIAKLA